MFTALYQIAKNTFRESLREPIFLLLLLMALCLIGLFPIFSLFVFSAQEKLVIDSAMATTMVFGWGLAILISSYAISREIDNGTALLLLSKPVQRPVFIIAKIFGILAANTVFCVLCSLATLISLRIASDQFRLDYTVMGVYFGAIALAFVIAGIYNYITRSSFPMAAVLALLVLIPMVAVFAHFLPYEGQRVGLSRALVPALLLIVFSVWAMGSLATALSTRFGLISNLLLCLVLFILGLMSDFLIGRNSLERWYDVPPEGKGTLWMSSYTFAPTELAPVGKWEAPRKIDTEDDFVVWSAQGRAGTLPRNLGSNPAQAWNDNDEWKNDIADLPGKPRQMAVYDQENRSWDVQVISAEAETVEEGASGMAAAYTSYVFRRSPNPPRVPTGGTYLNPFPKRGSWLASALYAAVPNWQLFWMADALANKLEVPGSYVLYAAAYVLVMNILLILLAVLLFWNREVGKQVIV
jgi:hypothetical protein